MDLYRKQGLGGEGFPLISCATKALVTTVH